MAKFPLITGVLIHNGGRGEKGTAVPFDYDERKTVPELMILLQIHGAELGAEAEVLEGPKVDRKSGLPDGPLWTGDLDMREADLKQTLIQKYGKPLVEKLFPANLPTGTDYPDARKWWAERDAAMRERVAAERKKNLDALKGLADDAAQEAERMPAAPAATGPEPDAGKAERLKRLRETYARMTGKKDAQFKGEDALVEAIAEAAAAPATEGA